jgi:hypothetical protein
MTSPPDLGALPAWLRLAVNDDLPYLDHSTDWTDRTVHVSRLLRAGWTTSHAAAPDAVWEHAAPGGASLIAAPSKRTSFATYGGRHVDEYALRTEAEDMVPLGEATWADWDHRGRLVIARDGLLCELDRRSGAVLRVVTDFNAQSPSPQPSPAWARAWPAQRRT